MRELWETQSQPGPAIVAGKRAVNTIQAMRAASSGLDQTLQQSFLQDKEVVYRNLADLLLAQDRPAEAQQVLDMLKEQEFYDYIQEDDAHDPRTTRAAFNRIEAAWNAGYDGIAEPLPALGERIATLSRIDASARTAEEQAELARLTTERDAATAELERLLAELPEHFAAIAPAQQAEANRTLANAPGNKQTLLAALSEQSGQPTGLLQFILLEDKVRLLLTTPAGWHTAVVETDADTLNTEIDALRTALTDSGSDAATPAQALYTRLVAPIAEAIDAAGLHSLLVHLDGKLRYIPFAALHDGEQWLAERWSLVYYTAASERQPEAAGSGGGDWRVAGLGVSEPRGKFTPLPAVEQEIDGIVREDDSDPNGVLPGRALLNTAFSETALRTEAADPANRILHLASHFDLHPGSDADSSLLLGTVADDGQPHTLSLKALRESKPPLDLRHIDLVTLSACNTFMGGADDTGVEIEGMGTIIQRQGARGVLASLWPVADASTGVLMQTFYRLRAERPDLTKAQALQQAQLGLLRGEQAPEAASGCAGDRRPIDVGGGDGSPGAAAQAVADAACGWRHPFYWAPFVLMGNWL
ncbi:CHAT domain-containing protein [Thiohalocapsa sp. ML1]|uniref:CHAT domain-containing protein n=1 Tax=Thiohalocapsa sp. ML1 TaxID=1431688 RepID=UPI000731F1D0|nr:CHAT domain-containing protein [Thiohalocapsa sp. ML1]